MIYLINFYWSIYLNYNSKLVLWWHHSLRTWELRHSNHRHRANAAGHPDMFAVPMAYDRYLVYQNVHAHFVLYTEVVFYLNFSLVEALHFFYTHLGLEQVEVNSGKNIMMIYIFIFVINKLKWFCIGLFLVFIWGFQVFFSIKFYIQYSLIYKNKKT